MRDGLPTKSPTANKIWRLSRILERSPFDPYVLSHTTAQADFIFQKYLEDNPDAFKFTRAGDDPDDDLPIDMALKLRWANFLIDKAAGEFWKKSLPSAAVLAKLRARQPGHAPTPQSNVRAFPPRNLPRPPKRT